MDTIINHSLRKHRRNENQARNFDTRGRSNGNDRNDATLRQTSSANLISWFPVSSQRMHIVNIEGPKASFVCVYSQTYDDSKAWMTFLAFSSSRTILINPYYKKDGAIVSGSSNLPFLFFWFLFFFLPRSSFLLFRH